MAGQKKRETKTAPKAAQRELTIRMYRHGLGDCFLLGLPCTGERDVFWMMIDCGVMLRTDDREGRFRKLIADVEKTVGPHGIDLLVITHEHYDHVSGFCFVADRFEKLGVREIWFAWTEDPSDSLAAELRRERDARRSNLSALVDTMQKDGHGQTPFALGATGLLEFFGMEAFGAAVVPPIKDAMEKIRNLPGAKIRYWQPNTVATDMSGLLKDLRIFVLGPPRDKTLLRRTEARGVHYEKLAADEQAFFAAVAGGAAASDYCPFDTGVGAPLRDWIAMVASRTGSPTHEADPYAAFLKAHYVGETKERRDQSWRRIDTSWYGAAADFALQLDGATNNTSLVLAIQDFGTGKVFLFPGDAQVGNWQSWQQCSWTIVDNKEKDNKKTVKANDLLSQTVFYKVGHHGSQNATMRQQGLGKMISNELVAMIPVHEPTARAMGWNDMPLATLLTALETATSGRTIRADESFADATKLKGRALPETVTEDDFFYELRFPL